MLVFCLALAWGLAGGATAAVVAPSSPAAPLTGALDNGVGFVIQPHGAGLGRVSVHLVVLNGSLSERENEQGFAHFVEHLAFCGTPRFPSGRLVAFFEELGLDFGSDLNAFTSYGNTIYKIDLPAGRAAQLETAISVLREFSDGITFEPSEIQRERAVILSEMQARNTGDWQKSRQWHKVLYSGTPLSDRPVSGDPKSLAAATPDTLRAFYRRCYQPAALRIIVTGDLDADAAKVLIERHFSSLRREGEAGHNTSVVLPPAKTLRVHFIERPERSGCNVTLVTVRPLSLAPKGLQEETLTNYSIAAALLARRVRERQQREAARIGYADIIHSSGPVSELLQYGLEASAAEEHWREAIGFVEEELRRVRKHGFSALEVREEIAMLRAAQHDRVGAFPGLSAKGVADAIASRLTSGGTWSMPATELKRQMEILDSLTPERLNAAANNLWDEAGLQLVYTSARLPEGGTAALEVAFRASASRPIGPDPSPLKPLPDFTYRPADTPASASFEEAVEDLGIRLVRFPNGVQVNLRRDQQEPGRFRLLARCGRGLRDLPRNQPGLAHLVAHFIGECNLGQHSHEEVRRHLRLRAIQFHTSYSDNHLMFELSGPAGELPFALRVLAATLDDVRLERTRIGPGLVDYISCRQHQLSDAADWARHAARKHMADGDPRLDSPPVETVGQYTIDAMESWTRRHWLEGPVSIGITGDIDPADAIASAAGTVGALSRRNEPEPSIDDLLRSRGTPTRVILRQPLADQAAAVAVAWNADKVGNLRHRCSQRLAHDVLIERLRKALRETQGVTYSPTGEVRFEARQRSFGWASVVLTFEPAKAEDMAERVVALASALAKGGVTEEEFRRLREPQRQSAAEALRSQGWWLEEVLTLAQEEPAVIGDARALRNAYDALTLEDVNAAAATYSAAQANTILILPAESAASAAQADAKAAYALIERSQAQFLRGNRSGALADINQAIALDPRQSAAYSLRAAFRNTSKDFTGALADAEKAIVLNPRNPDGFFQRSLIRLQKQDTAGALADINMSIELNPNFAPAYQVRSQLRRTLGDPYGAIDDLNRAGRLEMPSPPATDKEQPIPQPTVPKEISEAIALVKQAGQKRTKGEFSSAMRDYTAALKLDPRNTAALVGRAALWELREEHPKAIEDLDQAIRLDPNLAPAYSSRGYARFAIGDFDGAVADCNRAIATQRTYTAFSTRGLVHRARGDLAGAAADFSEALRLFPRSSNAPFYRGTLHLAEGNLQPALDDFQLAVANASVPNYVNILTYLCRKTMNPAHGPLELQTILDKGRDIWAKTIAKFLLGQISETELLAFIDNGAANLRANRRAEAHHVLGMLALIDADRAKAIFHFQKAVDQKVITGQADFLSRTALRRIEEAAKASP